MKEELDNLLCEKYPKIFADRNKPMTETCMFWGFECGDGWYPILNNLCSNIQHYVDWQNQNASKGYKQYKKVKQVVAVQVKEKFGTLRFYYDGGDDYVKGLVRMAESMSAVTCEQCGAPGTLRGKGWLHTACDTHTRAELPIDNEDCND